LEQFWHAFTSRGFDSVSWAFLWLKYNGLGIVRKTTKLIEGGLQDIGLRYYFYVFLTFLTFFFKIQKVVTFYFFCRVFVRFLELWLQVKFDAFLGKI